MINQPTAPNKPLYNRIIEMVGLYLLVQIPPLFLQMLGHHATFHNFYGYLILIGYLVLFLAAVMLAAWRFKKWSGQRIFHNFKLRDIGTAILTYLVILVGESVLLYLQQVIYHQQSTENNKAILDVMKASPVMMVGLVVSAVFLTPFLEELVFRGVLTNMFFKPTNLWAKVILSGVIFSSGHISGNPISFLVYVFIGGAMAYTYQRTQKQFITIIVHFLMNALAMTQLVMLVLH